MLGEAAEAQPVGQTSWRFLAPRPAAVSTWSVMLGRRAFLSVPIADDRVYCYCDVISGADYPAVEEPSGTRLRELFGDFSDPARRC